VNLKNKYLSIDFDGTLVKHKFPEIGEPMPHAFEVLKDLQRAGAKLFLNTCREDEPGGRAYLTEAIRFCRDQGIEFDGVNQNPLEYDFREKGLRRKMFAHIYIDDRNFGGFPGWDVIGRCLLLDHNYHWSVSKSGSKEELNRFLASMNDGETKKAHARRVREGWFEKYAPEDKPGIDIGCQFDPLNSTFRRYDVIFGDTDATYMKGVPDNGFHTVYCMEEGSLILTKDGFKPIEDITTSDYVWTHKRRWRKIKRNNVFPSQKSMKRLVVASNPLGVKITNNHPILVSSSSGTSEFVTAENITTEHMCQCPVVDYCNNIGQLDLATCLGENDNVKKFKAIQRIRQTQPSIGAKSLAKQFGLSVTHVRGWIYHGKTPYGYFVNANDIKFHSAKCNLVVPRFVDINKDIMMLLGYFLADGSLSAKKECQVGFHFHEKETEYIDDVIRIIKATFGFVPTDIRTANGCTSVRYVNKVLHTVMKSFFSSAKVHHKTIPTWAMWLNPKLQMFLIEGFFRGDGTKSGHSMCLNTVSYKLAEGLRLCLLRNKIFASLGKSKRPTEAVLKCGRNMHGCGYIYYVKWTDDKQHNRGGKICDDNILSRVKVIETVPSELPVYGLEVEEDESYYASGIMHHNSSHVLEHLVDPVTALRNWYRILQKDGHLIVVVPHRDLYERKKELPSLGNDDHKWFFLPDKTEAPCTLGLVQTVKKALGEDVNIVSLQVLNEGYQAKEGEHPLGEFSIEIIIKK